METFKNNTENMVSSVILAKKRNMALFGFFLYLYSFLQHGSPVHNEVTAHAGWPDVLARPDVGEDV